MSEEDRLSVSVPDGAGKTRLDKVLADLCPDHSRSRLKALIGDGAVCVNGVLCTDAARKVTDRDRLDVHIPPPEDDTPQAQNIPLDIVYEDGEMLVINKAAGMVVHPGAGQPDGTLVNALLHHCRDSLSGIGGVRRPGIVHRLDKDTSGLMVVAKTDRAHQGLADQLADRSLSRIYQALVWKVPVPLKGTIDKPVGRHPANRLKMSVRGRDGREAVTHYHMKQAYGESASFVECTLQTGRTHQIRVHMQAAGYPLIGDPLYGLPQQEGRSLLNRGGYDDEAKDKLLSFPRQALHAWTIRFIHPVSGEEMKFEVEMPDDMAALRGWLDLK